MRVATKWRWVLLVAAIAVITAGYLGFRILLSPAPPATDKRLLALAGSVEALVVNQMKSLSPDSEVVRLFGAFQTLALEKNAHIYSHDPAPYGWINLIRIGHFEKGQVPVRIHVPTNAKAPMKYTFRCYPFEADLRNLRDARIIIEQGKILLEFSVMSDLNNREVAGRQKEPFVLDINVDPKT